MAHKLVDLVVRGISQNVVTIIVDQKLVLLPLSEWNRLSQLPVSLAVELVSFDENSTTLLRGLKQNQIGRHSLSLSNLDDLANFDIFGGNRHNAAHAPPLGGSLEHCILRIVQIFVAPVPIEVVHAFLNHCHNQYKGEWCNVGEEESDFEEGHKLTDGDEQEKHVEEELELVVEDFGDKCEHVVLLVVEAIRAEVAR